MRIYISCDIEGVAGIVDRLQGNPEGGADYERGRRLMTAEVNAAIDGALDRGPADFVVNDAHGNMRNIVPNEMHGRARLIQGRLKPLYMAEGLDDSFDACFLIGYHAPAGAQFGVLNHALHPYNFRINGKPVTETTLTAAVAGHFGVPLVLLTSDAEGMRSAQELIGTDRFVGVVVKEGITRLSALSLHPDEAVERIRAGARDAIARIGDFRPFKFDYPVRVEMDLYYSIQADAVGLMPGVSRVGGRTVGFEAPDIVQAYRTLMASNILSHAFDR